MMECLRNPRLCSQGFYFIIELHCPLKIVILNFTHDSADEIIIQWLSLDVARNLITQATLPDGQSFKKLDNSSVHKTSRDYDAKRSVKTKSRTIFFRKRD